MVVERPELNSREKLHLWPSRLCQSECSLRCCPRALYKLAAATGTIKTIETYCSDEIHFHTKCLVNVSTTTKIQRWKKPHGDGEREGEDFHFRSVNPRALLSFGNNLIPLYTIVYIMVVNAIIETKVQFVRWSTKNLSQRDCQRVASIPAE